jgi:hypothetical protein
MGDTMNKNTLRKLPTMFALAFLAVLSAYAGDIPPAGTAPIKNTVTVRLLGDNKRMPEVTQDDVIVKQGKNQLQVTSWTPALGQQAGLDLFVLIDDASDTSLGSQYGDLRAFISAQPASTRVGVGYMQNGTVRMAQDFTTDHDKGAQALRLPLASSGAYGSPYLSVIDLMKRWPDTSNRREIVMITDGIDRFRARPIYRGSSQYISPDVDNASSVAQRTGTMIHTIFTRGIGRLGNNFWEINNGQNSLAKLSDETGGESYSLGMQNAVSFKPYLDSLQSALDNQYLLEYKAVPGKKAGLQPIQLNTPVAGVELNGADNAWVDAK